MAKDTKKKGGQAAKGGTQTTRGQAPQVQVVTASTPLPLTLSVIGGRPPNQRDLMLDDAGESPARSPSANMPGDGSLPLPALTLSTMGLDERRAGEPTASWGNTQGPLRSSTGSMSSSLLVPCTDSGNQSGISHATDMGARAPRLPTAVALPSSQLTSVVGSRHAPGKVQVKTHSELNSSRGAMEASIASRSTCSVSKPVSSGYDTTSGQSEGTERARKHAGKQKAASLASVGSIDAPLRQAMRNSLASTAQLGAGVDKLPQNSEEFKHRRAAHGRAERYLRDLRTNDDQVIAEELLARELAELDDRRYAEKIALEEGAVVNSNEFLLASQKEVDEHKETALAFKRLERYRLQDIVRQGFTNIPDQYIDWDGKGVLFATAPAPSRGSSIVELSHAHRASGTHEFHTPATCSGIIIRLLEVGTGSI
ncbi:hypothetical protein B0H10DRAFT_1954310 [Mycena sp. CBHHK59/15]|nr:hypothetical protein B0H10DRAFT_1954310 [Mycena sp. CBHHK59/15]